MENVKRNDIFPCIFTILKAGEHEKYKLFGVTLILHYSKCINFRKILPHILNLFYNLIAYCEVTGGHSDLLVGGNPHIFVKKGISTSSNSLAVGLLKVKKFKLTWKVTKVINVYAIAI